LLIIYEDEDLLVINKPAGMNTHAPTPYAGQGIYEWLRDREPRWEKLAIVHRLDKETSGVMVFGKSILANRSLTKQFTEHSVEKKYVMVTDRPVKKTMFTARSVLVRAGEKYLSRPIHAGGDLAETEFRFLRGAGEGRSIVEARPITGRTHQIRAHASEHGFPILGDELYGGTPADRIWLHAEEISLAHPASSERVNFRATADFAAKSRLALREAVIDAEGTNAYRLIHGASDKWPGWYVDRLGDFLLSQTEGGLSNERRKYLAGLLDRTQGRGAYHKTLMRQVRQTSAGEACPKLVLGERKRRQLRAQLWRRILGRAIPGSTR
jgi:RluA family pseudouridine synthase